MLECMYVNSREKSFMIFYKLLHYGNNMLECMYVNSREKSFTIFYKLLHYGNNMHECMYVNLKRFAAYLLIRVTSRNGIIA